jgi:hypothetical protein
MVPKLSALRRLDQNGLLDLTKYPNTTEFMPDITFYVDFGQKQLKGPSTRVRFLVSFHARLAFKTDIDPILH